MKRSEALALSALAFILVVTAGWWALALWPVAGETPEWLARARAVCFNVTGSGLPDASGWILLVGEPLGMLGVLAVIWKDSVLGGLARLARTAAGRGALAVTGLFVLGGIFATVVRVVDATEGSAVRLVRGAPPPASHPRLDRPAPATELVDASGARFELSDLRGRPVFVTFAFGHCETVCPLVVRNVVDARHVLGTRASSGANAPPLVVITLDPWRDTPERLSYLSEKWELPDGDRILSGTVAEVEAVLDAWNVPRSRNARTGDIIHPPLVYLLDAEGRIAFAVRGDVPTLVALAKRL